MDTKWKNRKKIISFAAFFIGISLVLGNIADLLREWSGESLPKYLDHVLEDDYQQSHSFRSYICGRLETFLAMASNSMGYAGYDYYYDDYYYNYNDYNYRYGEYGTATTVVEDTAIQGALEAYSYPDDYYHYLADYYNYLDYYDYPDDYYDYLDDYYDYLGDYDYNGKRRTLTEEQWDELNKKAAENYHNNIKGNKNLLYSIAYDGKVLYSNSDELAADGSLTAPEGYNFLLCYKEGKVSILKDGQELDIYGDGYYRDNSQWYVPGYHNFQVDEKLNNAVIYMAVAREPIRYAMETYKYGSGSIYRQTDNSLYWMRENSRAARNRLIRIRIALITGLGLLLLSLLLRRSKREADQGIARFTGKIWVEFKALFLFGILFLSFWSYLSDTYGYGYQLWQELTFELSYEYGSISTAGFYAGQLLRDLPALFWITLFWEIYLIINDLKYNKKVWKHSLYGKLYHGFSASGLRQPLPRKMAHRNAFLLGASVIYGGAMLSGACILSNLERNIW